MKKILTVAGSDSGGGAGIQADLKTVTALGHYGLSVIVALTAQNTLGVQGIHPVPADFVRLQIESVLSDIGADAVKTGMLAEPGIVEAVVDGLTAFPVRHLVVDPVMVAASGHMLVGNDALEAIKNRLLPLADIVTPNLAEAAALTGRPVNSLDDMKTAARLIRDMGPSCVLIKGGHLRGPACDLLFDGREDRIIENPRIHSQHTHGTGCTLSAALATFLAQGFPMPEAVREAKKFITEAILAARPIGRGHGPTNHMVRIQRLQAREQVLSELQQSLDSLLREPLGHLIPEIRSNLAYALPAAASAEDVAAIPGRITRVGRRLAVVAAPAFGASRHVASVVLTAMRYHPETRAAMAIRYSPEILAACREIGLTEACFDRADEPEDVRDREGSSLEWGMTRVLEGGKPMPDLIFDRGGPGKEPVIRLLASTPMEIVARCVRIGQTAA